MRTIWSITPVYDDNICRNLCQVFATSLSHPTSLTAGQRLLPLSPLSPSPSFLFASSSSIIIVILIFITTIIIIIEIRWAVVPPQFYSHGHNQVCTSTMFSNDKWAKRCDDGKLVLMKCDGDEVVKWASERFSSEPFHSWWCAESWYCVTRAPLLLLRSWVARSFKVGQWVRYRCHPTKSPLFSIFKGKQAL